MRRDFGWRATGFTLSAVLLASIAVDPREITAPGGVVTVLASFTGSERENFLAVLREFEVETGIRVDYDGTRAVSQVLRSAVRQGAPPDVAILPSPQELAQYRQSLDLEPLDELDQGPYSEQWQRLQRIDRVRPYAVPVKVELKSLVWYGTERFHEDEPPPRTWGELLEISESIAAGGDPPWCMGMESAPTSGWPGTDWLEDILLHQSGPAVYAEWAAGRLEWDSDAVRRAWETWDQIVGVPGMVQGGPEAALLTNFRDAGIPLVSGDEGCVLEHQASFMLGFYNEHHRDTTPPPVNFFPFPPFETPHTAVLVSADLAGMFNDTPQARRLMAFLATTTAQEIMPAKTGGYTFSANNQVYAGTDAYRAQSGPVVGDIAATLTDGSRPLCFDASDLMPAEMRTAFYHAVLRHLHEVGQPAALDLLLEELDQVRQQLRGVQGDPAAETWFTEDYPCGEL